MHGEDNRVSWYNGDRFIENYEGAAYQEEVANQEDAYTKEGRVLQSSYGKVPSLPASPTANTRSKKKLDMG